MVRALLWGQVRSPWWLISPVPGARYNDGVAVPEIGLPRRTVVASDDFVSDGNTTPGGARSLFERFTRRLIGLARSHLDARLLHKIDPEDVVQSAYKSFFLRYGEGALAAEGWDGLWGLLTCITLRKCSERVRYLRAECRDIAREAVGTPGPEGIEPWRDALSREPTPEQAVVLAETVERILRGLDVDERPIFELSLQGCSTQEISAQLGRAERSVRRLRERVRLQLERLQADAAL
jgi:RNA polymerase sigma-70 factor (ECF subfamily)